MRSWKWSTGLMWCGGAILFSLWFHLLLGLIFSESGHVPGVPQGGKEHPRVCGRTGARRWPSWHHRTTWGWICTWGHTSPSGSVAIPVSSLAYNLNFVLLELVVKSQDVLNPDLSCGLYGERAVHSPDFPLSSLVALNLFFLLGPSHLSDFMHWWCPKWSLWTSSHWSPLPLSLGNLTKSHSLESAFGVNGNASF